MKANEGLRSVMFNLISRWESSGLKQKEFCQTEGVNYYKFKYWKTRQNKEQQLSQQKPLAPLADFIPISTPNFNSPITGIELTYPNGVKLNCNQSLETAQIKELIHLF